MKGDTIEDISFDGEACVISISSTSIMSNLLKGKTIDEVWNEYCRVCGKPLDREWLPIVMDYEKNVLRNRK